MLINGKLFRLNNLYLQVFDIIVIEVEAPLECHLMCNF